jgi:hypothetical protein
VTVAKGQSWGRPAMELAAAGRVEVRSDAAARLAVERARRDGRPVPPLVLLSGDLCRTVGGMVASSAGAPHAASPDAVALPCDVGSVLLDGRQFWFVAHLVARRSWWRGRVLAVMNAQFVGRYDVAPRAHPNDGVLDVVEVGPSFGVRDRLAARRRLPTGTHVPHPGVVVRRVAAFQDEFDPPLRVWLDGVAVGAVRRISVRVEPDALIAIV